MEKTSVRTKEYEILKQLRRRFAKEFLDLIILAKLCSSSFASGYALMKHIHQKYKIFLSSGTVYSTLYAMERNGLIRGEWKERRRIYYLTPKGKEVIQTVKNRIENMKSLFDHLELADEKQKEKFTIASISSSL